MAAINPGRLVENIRYLLITR